MSLTSVIAALTPFKYLRLGESSGTSAADIGSAATAGTYTPNLAGAWTGGNLAQWGSAGDADTCARFDGVTGYVDLGTMGTFGSSMGSGVTVVCMVKCADTAAAHVICGRNEGALKNGLRILLNRKSDSNLSAGCIQVILYDNSGTMKTLNGGANTDTAICDGKWHMLAVTINPATNTIVILVDNASKTVTYALQETPNTFANYATWGMSIGAVNNGGNQAYYFQGFLDEFAIWPSIVSDANLTAIYNAWIATQYTLSGNANWSAIKASIANYWMIKAGGAYTLTLDEDPALTNIGFEGNGQSGLIAIGTPSTVTLNGWALSPYNVACLTIGTGKTVTGPVTAYGCISSTSHPCISISSGGALGSGVGYGGTGASNRGILVNSGALLTTGVGFGSNSTQDVQGINVLAGSTAGTITGTGGTAGTIAYGASIAGSVTTVIGYGAPSTVACPGVNLAATNTVTNVTGTGGGFAGATGVNITSGSAANVTGTGSATVAAVGVIVSSGVSITNATCTAGGAFGANGLLLSVDSVIANITAAGSSTAGTRGCYNNGGVIRGGTATGGTVSNSPGIVNYGSCYNVVCSGNTAGAYGLANYGMVVLDARNLSGYAVSRPDAAGVMILFGGTSQTAITGTAGIIRFIPTAAQTQSGVAVLEETGTGPAPGFLRKMTDG